MKENTHTTSRAEAERLIGLAEKLLSSRDLNGAKEFANLAQEADPLFEGTDQVLAIVEVLLASEKRLINTTNNNNLDWYSILQIDRASINDLDLVKKQYRRLAFLLHPDKNRYAFAEQAFRLVSDAWSVLSDPARKSQFDSKLNVFSKVDLTASKLPVWRSQQQRPNASTNPNLNFVPNSNSNPSPNLHSGTNPSSNVSTGVNQNVEVGEEEEEENGGDLTSAAFWTVCPYCYFLYEYPMVYENCCMRCQNCERAFHAVFIPSMPPLVPGKESYYCCWGYFPLGFTDGAVGCQQKTPDFPTWMPSMFSTELQKTGSSKKKAPTLSAPATTPGAFTPAQNGVFGASAGSMPVSGTGKKRGRPRKNPLPTQ